MNRRRSVALARVFACTLVCAVAGGCGAGNPMIAAPSSPSTTGSVAHAAHMAASETILYSFGGPGGDGPNFGMIADKTGAFYGTTIFGGSGGTVFKLTPRRSGYAVSTLYDFPGGGGGNAPEGVIMGSGGALYGVTLAGGVGNGGAGWGTVFKLSPGVSGYSQSVLHRFGGYPDAGAPNGPIVLDKSGALYGSSFFGGANNTGTVFKVAPNGSSYSESVIYSFPAYGTPGGQNPQAGVAIDDRGNVYGTTAYGGSFQGICGSLGGCGTVFEISRTKSGYSERVIHAFQASADGDQPDGVPTVDDRTGAIYGTTAYATSPRTYGTVYKLVPKGSAYVESVLYTFTGGADGFSPEGAILVARDGSLYGTTSLGGGGCSGIGCGTVFELRSSPGGYSYRAVFRFARPSHGADPEQTNLLTDASGALFGTTRSGGSATRCYDGGPGGAKGCGVVFKITAADR
jgi:uncharacterized repeat protein (TIGR03803 family)